MKSGIRKSWLALVLCAALIGTGLSPVLRTEAAEILQDGEEAGPDSLTPDSDLGDEGGQTPTADQGDGETDKQNQEESPDRENSEPGDEELDQTEETVGVEYQTHVQTYGWQQNVKDGAMAGTEGKGKRLEAIKISLVNLPEEYAGSGIQYSVHVQTYGWQDGLADGAVAGTEGKAKRLEAISINLTGPIAEDYSVYYRTHVQTYGWMGWAKDGGRSGSAQYAKRMEAIEIRLVKKDEEAPGDTADAYRCPLVSYTTHMQSYGWRSSVFDDAVGGVTGRSKRMEALKISLPDPIGTTGYNGGISYCVYLQGSGWQDWKSDGELAGTTGQKKRIEAVKIKLTGDISAQYDVYYSLHLAKVGWTNYTLGGEDAVAGSTNLSKRIEAVKIRLVKKGEAAPDTSGVNYIRGLNTEDFYYRGNIQGKGESADVISGGILGTTGEGKSLESLSIFLNNQEGGCPQGEVRYATHLSSVGWQTETGTGTVNGSTDGAHSIQAVKISLTGELAKYYDVYYRAHVQKYGWLGWAKNGQAAGTTKIGYRLEALQIKLVSKDGTAPGSNSRYYTETKFNPGPNAAMVARANMYSSPTKYIVMVDRSAHTVGIYQGARGFWSNVKYWACGTGAPATPTVSGVFSVGNKGYYFNSGAYRCFWWTQFYGDYLFHSVLCWPNGAIADGRVGMALSHGCVRLEIQNAKWIYDNVPRGTTVVVYN